MELLVALLLGIPALIWGLRWRREEEAELPAELDATSGAAAKGDDGSEDRMMRAVAGGLVLWVLTGIVLFSHMARLHPRYVEGMVPPVAAMLGIGAAWAAIPRGRLRPAVLTVTLLIAVVYTERLLYGTPLVWWISLAGAFLALACMILARVSAIPERLRTVLAPAGVLVMTLCAVLAISVSTDITAIDNHVTDAGYVGALPADEQQVISSYLRSHQGSARYEVAAQSATQIGSLIVQDARPIVVLTSYAAREFTSTAKLKRLIARGEVRYAFLNSPCPHHLSPKNPACSAPAQWIRAHGTDVSRKAGLDHGKALWLLPGAAE